jgi:hypothetical protein
MGSWAHGLMGSWDVSCRRQIVDAGARGAGLWVLVESAATRRRRACQTRYRWLLRVHVVVQSRVAF